jgi:hypothetical protein
MPKKKTWIWILVACGAVCIVGLLAMATAGVIFVSNHIQAHASTSADALRRFEAAKAPFKDQRPLFELDQRERVRLTRELSGLPSAATKPHDLYILAWDPADGALEGRLVSVSLPFWLLKLGRRKIDIFQGDHSGAGFDLERLNLDMRELERVGAMLVVDHQTPTGERVLVWTQ